MKPIEPGCLAMLMRAGNFSNTIVTVIGRTIPQMPNPMAGAWWEIASSSLEAATRSAPASCLNHWPWAAHESNLQRIDDGDFDPTADGEENPFMKQVPHVWSPARQV